MRASRDRTRLFADMRDEDFAALLGSAAAGELRGVEFKGPGPWANKGRHRDLRLKVIRAVLGMVNLRDGGHIVIGVEEDAAGVPVFKGINAGDLGSWRFDDVAAAINEYADPSVTLRLDRQGYNGADLILLTVYEFDDVPVICKRPDQTSNKESVLRRGACYVRGAGKPETSEIPSQTEMRGLLELAAEKRLSRLLGLVSRAGGVIAPPVRRLRDSDAEAFDEQLGGM